MDQHNDRSPSPANNHEESPDVTSAPGLSQTRQCCDEPCQQTTSHGMAKSYRTLSTSRPRQYASSAGTSPSSRWDTICEGEIDGLNAQTKCTSRNTGSEPSEGAKCLMYSPSRSYIMSTAPTSRSTGSRTLVDEVCDNSVTGSWSTDTCADLVLEDESVSGVAGILYHETRLSILATKSPEKLLEMYKPTLDALNDSSQSPESLVKRNPLNHEQSADIKELSFEHRLKRMGTRDMLHRYLFEDASNSPWSIYNLRVRTSSTLFE
jgi:hypothetical protein